MSIIIALILVLGGEYYFLGTLMISDNMMVSFVINGLFVLMAAGMFAPITDRTSDLIDADIRSNK